MAARRSAQLKDFNRRRSLMLTKAEDMALHQRGTSLSRCLLETNPREKRRGEEDNEALKRAQTRLERRWGAEMRRFLDHGVVASQPSVLMERRRDNTVQGSLVLVQPRLKQRFNLWEAGTRTVSSEKDHEKEWDEENVELKSDTALEGASGREAAVRFLPGGGLSWEDRGELGRYWFSWRRDRACDDDTRLRRNQSANDRWTVVARRQPPSGRPLSTALPRSRTALTTVPTICPPLSIKPHRVLSASAFITQSS